MDHKMEVLQRIESKLDSVLKNQREQNVKPPCRSKRVKFTRWPENVSSFERSDQTFEDPHQVVIRENFESLVSNIDLTNTLILDQFYQDDALSCSDMENLNKSSIRKEKTRLFMVKLHRYSPEHFSKFLDLLQNEQEELAKTLKRDLEEKKRLDRQWHCLSCKIEKDVDLNDILDFLYQERIICLNDLNDVLHNNNWHLLRRCVNTSNNTFQIFISSMSRKYGHLAQELNKYTRLQCICGSMKTLSDADSSSESESVVEDSVEWWTHYERRGLVRHATFYQRKRVLSGLCRHESLLRTTVLSGVGETTTVPSKSSSFPSLRSKQLKSLNHDMQFTAQNPSLEIYRSGSSLSCQESSSMKVMFPGLEENTPVHSKSCSFPTLKFKLPRYLDESQFSTQSLGAFRFKSLMNISENKVESFNTDYQKLKAWDVEIQEGPFCRTCGIETNSSNSIESLSHADSDNESVIYSDRCKISRSSLKRNTALRYTRRMADVIRERYIHQTV